MQFYTKNSGGILTGVGQLFGLILLMASANYLGLIEIFRKLIEKLGSDINLQTTANKVFLELSSTLYTLSDGAVSIKLQDELAIAALAVIALFLAKIFM